MRLVPKTNLGLEAMEMLENVWVGEVSADGLAEHPELEGRWHRFVGPTADNRGLTFGMGELEPGEVAGWHTHLEPEVFFVLEGTGEARWEEEADGEVVTDVLAPGRAFYKVGGVPHQMVNTGEVPLRGVFFKVVAT